VEETTQNRCHDLQDPLQARAPETPCRSLLGTVAIVV
jgi:hypothetical protein